VLTLRAEKTVEYWLFLSPNECVPVGENFYLGVF
jgi:hypothetical protein